MKLKGNSLDSYSANICIHATFKVVGIKTIEEAMPPLYHFIVSRFNVFGRESPNFIGSVKELPLSK